MGMNRSSLVLLSRVGKEAPTSLNVLVVAGRTVRFSPHPR
jgi:hypothetical protein